MYRQRLVRWIVSLLLFGGAMAPTSAQGQRSPDMIPPVTPDISTPVTPVSPSFRSAPGTTGSTSPSGIASGLLQQIAEAEDLCAKSIAEASNDPRRFARGPGDPDVVCASPECARLNSLFEEANTFLQDVEAGRAAPAPQLW